MVSRAGVRDDQVEDVVAEAEQAAADGTPAEDASRCSGRATIGEEQLGRGPTGRPVPSTQIGGLARVRGGAGAARSRPREAAGRKLYGYAEHSLTSTFLGTSSGLRLRHDQPTGKVELNARSADLARSAWAGAAPRTSPT